MTDIYKYHPAYQEGMIAFSEGERRGRNPYSAGGDQSACIAWWKGWDDASIEDPDKADTHANYDYE